MLLQTYLDLPLFSQVMLKYLLECLARLFPLYEVAIAILFVLQNCSYNFLSVRVAGREEMMRIRKLRST